jgi:Protein of unknown function (DUF2975)
MDRTRSSDPLRRLEVFVGLIVVVMALAAVLLLVGTVAGSSAIPGVDAEVCVTTSGEGQPGFRAAEGDRTGPVGLADGITWHVEQVKVCDPEPDGATRGLAAVGLAVWIGAPVLFFSLLWLLLRRARRYGVFADRVPGGLRRLGTLLLVWAALDFVVTGFVDGALITRMTDDTLVMFTGDLSLLLVLLGLALLALERVMEQAVAMRHDVEATI